MIGMAACLGINVELVFFVVFCVGCALAGLAGVVAAPVLSMHPNMGTEILIPTLIVVVIGGLGSLKGAVDRFAVGRLPPDIRRGAGAADRLRRDLRAARRRADLLGPPGLFPARS